MKSCESPDPVWDLGHASTPCEYSLQYSSFAAIKREHSEFSQSHFNAVSPFGLPMSTAIQALLRSPLINQFDGTSVGANMTANLPLPSQGTSPVSSSYHTNSPKVRRGTIDSDTKLLYLQQAASRCHIKACTSVHQQSQPTVPTGR